MKKNHIPLISCICVTRGKPEFLQRAITCFLSQTYENKELIVVYDNDDYFTERLAKSIKNDSIKFYEVEKNLTVSLGYLRNYAIDRSCGDYICQWDDDDWYHCGRLEFQMEVLNTTNYPASIVTQWVVFDSTTRKSYVSNKRTWEGSLLCEKKTIKGIKYPEISIGEDTPVIGRLLKENKLYLIDEIPNLYIYTYHGKNSWNYDHWKQIFDKSYELGDKDSYTISNILCGKYEPEEGSLLLDALLENPIFSENLPTKRNFIPKIIHLTYKNKDIPEYYDYYVNRLKKLHPNWEIILYDDNDALNIVKENFSEIMDVYNSYSCNIQRVDLFRILIVYLKGGFYLDLDIYCQKSLDSLCDMDLVLGIEKTYSDRELKEIKLNHSQQIANYMFGSIPFNLFWIEVLLEAIKRSSHTIETEDDILYTTGPWLLTDVYNSVHENYPNTKTLQNKFRECLVKWCPNISCRFGEYAAHLHFGSWRWQSEKKVQSTPKRMEKITSTKIDVVWSQVYRKYFLNEKF